MFQANSAELPRRAAIAALLGCALLQLPGCGATPARQAYDAALVVHTAGSSQHMIAARVPAEATAVFQAFDAVIERRPDVAVFNRKDNAMLLEVARDDVRVTGQVTALNDEESLLYVWADAGESGITGKEVATATVEAICDELGVTFERVDY